MDKQAQGLADSLARRVLAIFGALGMFGIAMPADATPLPERAALEARVLEMRRHLAGEASVEAREKSSAPTLFAQAKWNNWPNWSNWANWRNG